MDSEFTGPFLVVGGCGFLGHHMVNEIFKDVAGSPNVAVLDNNTHNNRHPSATYHNADITRPSEIARVFEEVKPQVVFHTVSPYPFITDHSVLEKVNIVGTQNLIDCAKAVETVRAFVFTSSSSVVHNQRQPMVEATEDLPVLYFPDQPVFYSHTKAAAETIVLSANREGGMLTASVRPTTLYGAGCGLLTTSMTKQVLSGRANVRFGHGSYLYDITYAENCTHFQMLVARKLVEAASSAPLPVNTRVEGEAFFVSNDEHIPFWDLQRLAANVAGRPVKDNEVRHIPIWLIFTIATLGSWAYWICSFGRKQPALTPLMVRLTTMERTVCIDKAKGRLGYKPRFTNREGWVKALEWSLSSQQGPGKPKSA